MVQSRSVLKVIDNSGAKYVRCLKVLGKKKSGYLGDLLVVSVLSLRRGRGRKIRVKKKEICLALLTSTRFKFPRVAKCFLLKPSSNSVILLTRSMKPIGNRVFGLIFKELRLKKKFKALSIASNIL
jgi:large subunit ribosomal protein L14